MRRELVVPPELAGVRVERDDRIGVEVVAGPLRAVVVGADVADAPVGQVELRIVGARQPDRPAAVLPGLGIADGRVGGARSHVSAPGSPGAGIV